MAPMLFTDAILHNRPIKVFNYGEMSRDFTYVEDIIDGCIKVIDNPAQSNKEWDGKHPEIQSSLAPYRLYNIGNNAPVKLLNFIETLEKSINKRAEKNLMEIQPGDVVSTYADVSELVKNFDYKPDTSLAEGIDELVKWYKRFYSIKI